MGALGAAPWAVGLRVSAPHEPCQPAFFLLPLLDFLQQLGLEFGFFSGGAAFAGHAQVGFGGVHVAVVFVADVVEELSLIHISEPTRRS